ncbi:MAG: AAA family ATPase [Myxococcales bacterium]|nr:AAA family ATPase [Myxococcales bacterium]
MTAEMFPGFRVTETLHEGQNAVVYRGVRVADGRPVILKRLAEEYPSPERLAGLRQEFAISRELSTDPAACALEVGEPWLMVLDDFGGTALDRLGLAGELELVPFLRLAIRIAERVAELHRHRVIHRDINPANIVMNVATGEVRLIDFSMSMLLQRHNTGFASPSVLEGTLAYIAPEQTGRMNRAIDHRADLYSLGVTLYELLIGEPPFPGGDPIELVHSHIAKLPGAPSELRPAIPAAVSRIVLKLLAKNAEDRYQSALGLAHDLQRCLAAAERGAPVELPVLGERDVSERFYVPETLYGRQHEVEALLAAFDRVSVGGCEVAVVSGAPGIGKSALVRELYRPVTRERGYFIAGKYDQFNRNVPYSALLQAFRSLVRQLLAEPPERVAAWKRRVLAAVSANGQVLLGVIPELELIVGPQPDLPELRPEDAHNRFNLTFQSFIRVFTAPEHPLVLFLDDLQWADHASLELLEVLMSSGQAGGLLVIVAHRSNEVDASHPLLMMLDRIRAGGVRFTDVHLHPLASDHVGELVADTVRCSREEAAPLAALVAAKTGGNPFFVGEFLRHLHGDGLIELERERWHWDLEQIRRRNITDNVVELMARRIGELDPGTQDVLRIAAALGDRFDLRAVAMTSEQPAAAVARALWQALQADLIAPVGEMIALLNLEVEADAVPAFELRFTHDRIQQAVSAITPEAERPALHRRVGQHLLDRTPPDEVPARIFEIVGHLNHSAPTLTGWDERARLARLNLTAAERARDASAFSAAYTYYKLGAELVGDEGWTRDYALTFAFGRGAAEAACMLRDTAVMERIAAVTLARARGTLDRVKIQQVLIQAQTLQLDLKSAVRVAVAALRELGVRMPAEPSKLDVVVATLRTRLFLANKKVEAFSSLPPATDPLVLARAEVMANVISAAYRGAPNAFILLVLEIVKLSIQHGNSPASGFAYTCYALILSGALGDIAGGTRLVPVAEAMLDMPMTRAFKAKTLFALGAFVLPWSAHMRVCAERLYDGFMSGLEVGDLEFAAHCGYLRSYFRLRTCDNLQELIVDLERMAAALHPLGQDRSAELCLLYLQVARNLRGQAKSPAALVGERFDIEANLAESYRLSDTRAIVESNLQRLVLEFMFGKLDAARATADRIPGHLADLPGFPPACESRYFDALVVLADAGRLTGAARRAAVRRAERDLAKLRVWAAASPVNYSHMRLLVEAELQRVAGRQGEARVLYDRAIAACAEHHLLRDEGIACELAAAFYAASDLRELALHYLRRAHRAYLHWGATAKVEALELASPQLVASRQAVPNLGRGTVHASSLASSLDLTSVLRASQAISSEIVQERLLDALIKVVMESAGADRGALLQQREGAWECTVEGRMAPGGISITRGAPVGGDRLATSVLHYVARTREVVVRDGPAPGGPLGEDPYLAAAHVRSLLCMPLVNQSRLVGVLYLENSVSDGAFSEARLSFLRMLAAQMAISLENSDLFSNLERMVERRTAELREANASLVLSNQELDAFARTVAHDLKNPLGTIAGYARYLLDDLEAVDRDELLEVLGRIEKSGEHTVRIVNELLLLASVRKGQVKMAPVDMEAVVQGALARLDAMLGEYGVTVEGPGQWPTALGHAPWIEEIWANYLSNAMKYGGRPPRVQVGATLEGDEHVRFWVRDNGPGISAAEQERVFAEFTRLEGARAEGHGLGLSIVKRIADRLDGSVGLTSELGAGSTFYFTLPRARPPS